MFCVSLWYEPENLISMEQPRRYPIGIQTFSELINKQYLYIDKTEYVYRMAHGNSKYLFLSRPRRFGKSKGGKTFSKGWLSSSWRRNGHPIRYCIST